MADTTAFRIETRKGQRILHYLCPFSGRKYFEAVLYLKSPDEYGENSIPGHRTKVCPYQIHGTDIIEAVPNLCLPSNPEADGVVLDRLNLYVSLRFADCFPVVISSLSPVPWIVLLHSGYRGTVKNIAGKAMEIITSRYGMRYAINAVAWIGPGIGPCCYVRDSDDPFTVKGLSSLPDGCVSNAPFGKVSIDMGKAIVEQLLEKGFSRNRIFRITDCTCCNSGLFYSYRKDKTQKRMSLVARLI